MTEDIVEEQRAIKRTSDLDWTLYLCAVGLAAIIIAGTAYTTSRIVASETANQYLQREAQKCHGTRMKTFNEPAPKRKDTPDD